MLVVDRGAAGVSLLVGGFLCLLACGGGGDSGSDGRQGGDGPGSGPDNPPDNSLPVASFAISAATALPGTEIGYDASASSDRDGRITDYRWEFDDGTRLQGVQVSRVFQSLGEKTVTLTVSDDRGASVSATQSITIIGANEISLSGSISVSGNVGTDGDVNDPAAPYAPNDTLAQAQVLPNPVTLNGFVSTTGTGRTGDRFDNAGDATDVFQLELLGGQRITLQVADFAPDEPNRNDIDVFLYNSDRELVRASNGATEFESLTVPADGRYYVMVDPFSGISKYVLRVGNDFTSGRSASPAGSTDFIAHEFVVARPDRGASSASTLASASVSEVLAGAAPALRTVGGAGGTSLSRCRDRQHCQQLVDELRAQRGVAPGLLSAARSAAQQLDRALYDNDHYLTLQLIKELRRGDEALVVEPNYRVYASRLPDDDLGPLQWHYPFIHLPEAWDYETGGRPGNRPLVAVVDTGVLLRHPDLAGQLVAGYDFISSPAVAADGDGIDSDPDDVGDRDGPGAQSTFHGTHVAGTVAARTDNASGVGGVAWGARIMPVRTLGIGGGSNYDLSQAIRYAAGLANDSETLPARRADIINLSLGCAACFSQVLEDAIAEARAEGVIVIAAAGNLSNSTPFYPAAYPGVVGVSSVTSGSTHAAYSNFGGFVDVAAPGGDDLDRNGDGYSDAVLSTAGADGSGAIEFRYGWMSGTSMAAPHVAGVAALMKALYPALTPEQFDQALASGAVVTDLPPQGRDDTFGHGVIDALKAVQWASDLDGEPLPGTLLPTPSVLDFPLGVSQQSFTLSPVGDNPPSVVAVVANASWLTVEAAADVGADGVGRYLVRVDRRGLATAVYQGAIDIGLSDGRGLTLPVQLQVLANTGGAGDPGQLYVLLRADGAQEAAYEVAVRRSESGVLMFHFDRRVAAGAYRLYAGTDIDHDGVVCGVGESCGAYPTLDTAELLYIDADTAGLDFDVVNRADFALEQARASGGAAQRREKGREKGPREWNR